MNYYHFWNVAVISVLLVIKIQAYSVLFPENGQYIYSFKATVSTGSIIPKALVSSHGIKGNIGIQRQSDSVLLLKLSSLRHMLFNGEELLDQADRNYKAIPEEAEFLKKSFVVSLNPEGLIYSINFTQNEPLWSMNMKRAIAANLQMHNKIKMLPGAFRTLEPCLHDVCAMEYSSSDGMKIRKSNNVPTLEPSPTHDLWMTIMPNICSMDVKENFKPLETVGTTVRDSKDSRYSFYKNPLIGSTNRWYYIDEKGLLNLVSDGNIEVHYHTHIFQSLTNFSMERIDVTGEIPKDNETHVVQTGIPFQPPDRQEPTGGRSPLSPEVHLQYLFEVLGRLADGLEQVGLTDTLLKDKLPLRLQGIISMLSYDTLKKAHEELQLGTSYKWETMKNIFLEVLPQAKSKVAMHLVRDLVVDRLIRDEMTILQLLRKFPFNVADLSQDLLLDMEPLLKLSQEHSQDVRHAAILGFSTLVFKTFVGKACTTDVFEHYVQTYFSRFTESPDYSDRLVWLSGLSNLQLEHVTSYLAPLITGTLGHSIHERFYAVWATMPLAHRYPTEVHNTYWPILHNKGEPLEMRVAAITMLLFSEPTTHRLLSLYWYISSQSCPHLKNFFYTTIKSLEHTTFDCYKNISKLASYLSKLMKQPEDYSKLWATGNYLMDAADFQRDMGFMFHSMSIANPTTGLPDILYFSLITQNAGLIIQDYAVYLKLQGVASNFFNNLHKMNGDALRLEELEAVLKKLKVKPKLPEPVHVEFVLKYQGRVVYALHLNQTAFEKWTNGDFKKSINNLLQSERHINQQILVYPTILKSILASEIGTPIITDTIISSLTSIRGNLTNSMENDEIARKNDVHFRTSTLALISLAAYNPIADSYHLAEVAQVSDAYAPANFTVAISIIRKLLRTRWLSRGGDQSPGFVAYSGSRVAITPSQNITFKDFCPSCPLEMFGSGNHLVSSSYGAVNLKCDGPSSLQELFWQLITSHKSNSNVFPAGKPFLVLLHAFVLATIPADGPCKISITSPKSREIPEQTDTEIEYVTNTATNNKLRFKIGSVTKEYGGKSSILSSFNSSSIFELSDSKIKLILKASGKSSPENKNWKVCFEAEENYVDDTELYDIGSTNTLIGGYVKILVGPYTNNCPVNGTEIGVSMQSKDSINSDSFDFKVDIKNLPSEISSISTKYSRVMDIFQPTISFDVTKLLLDEFSNQNVLMNVSVVSEKKNSKLTLRTQNATATSKWDDNYLSWLLTPKGQMYIPKEMGIIKECRLKSNSIFDVNKQEVELGSSRNCELLVIGECSSLPRFAIIRLPSPHGIGLKIYTGGNYAEVQPTASDNLKLLVNGKEVNWQPSYQYPENEQFYDFKVSGSGSRLKLESKISALKVVYRKNDVVILLPTTHLPLSCGACIQSQTLHTKC